MANEPHHRDPWSRLRKLTHARIGLSRSGSGLTTRDHLAFELDCARARDAVHAALDIAALAAELTPLGCLVVGSKATSRADYLRYPDRGRQLDDESAARLEPSNADIALIIADGLSATAVQNHAVATARAIIAATPDLSHSPIIIARQARVALSDPIGERLGVKATVMLIGERPGLSAPDSLGIYMTFRPGVGRTDADRNCISNIHRAGLSYDDAARKLAWLVRTAFAHGRGGVSLKEDADAPSRLRVE